MAAKKRPGLGRGLGALIGDSVSEVVEDSSQHTEAVSIAQAEKSDGLQIVAIEKIERGRYQPRLHFDQDALNTLAESIKQQGILQPLVLRKQSDNSFELIAGERRWRAAQLAGLDVVPAVVREMDDETAAAVALIENIQRENLGPLEEAKGFKRLIDEFTLTHQQVADVVSRSRVMVSNLLRLLDLDDSVKQQLEANKIQMGHARAILALPAHKQSAIAEQVEAQGLSVRQTEKLVSQTLNPSSKKAEDVKDPNITRLEQDLAEKVGAKVAIQHSSSGKGKLVISYTNNDELQGILDKIH